MIEDEQTDICAALGHISSNVPFGLSAREKRKQLLAFWSIAGLTLEVCSDAQHLNLAISTLRRYARELGLSFSDYTPRALKEVAST